MDDETPVNPLFSLSDIETEPIERIEEGGDTVRYKSILALAPGVWTDSGSRETIWYSPEGIRNLEVVDDNVVNIMHDSENSVSQAGQIDPESVEATDNGLYVDVVVDTTNAAGQYADENMQATLESGGAKGFGGPSVEISAEGQDVEFNNKKGMQELKGGRITGLGFVKSPASKSASFSRQVAQRGVALADAESGRTVMKLQSETHAMDEAELEELREKHGLSDDVDASTIQELAEAGLLSLEEDDDEEEEDEEEEDTENAEDEDEPPEEEEGDEDDEPEEDEEPDLEDQVAAMDERLQNLEDMIESAMAAEDVQEELEAFEEELADAETVSELSEAKEDLEKRLSALEDEPKTPRSLADGEEEEEMGGSATLAHSYDQRSGTISR